MSSASRPVGLCLALSGLLALVAPAARADTLRVAIAEGKAQVRLGASTTAEIRDAQGRRLGSLDPQQGVYAQEENGRVEIGTVRASQLWIVPTAADGLVWIGDRWYRGRAQLVPQDNGLTAINVVDVEDYLYSVVGSESPASWPLDALRAQAVAARSYVLYRQGQSRNPLYDVGTTTRWQVYKGVEAEAPSTIQAVHDTLGQVLTYGGRVIEAVFHASSGGHTENVEDVWNSALPYLRGVPDFDQSAPVFRWSKSFSVAEISQRLTGVGQVRAVEAIAMTPQGRVRSARVVGDQGSRTMTGDQIRKALDLRSSLFTVTPTNSLFSLGGLTTGGQPDSFQVEGRGFGHGLGLSQWGAFGMASQGFGYQTILGHFYRQASLAKGY